MPLVPPSKLCGKPEALDREQAILALFMAYIQVSENPPVIGAAVAPDSPLRRDAVRNWEATCAQLWGCLEAIDHLATRSENAAQFRRHT